MPTTKTAVPAEHRADFEDTIANALASVASMNQMRNELSSTLAHLRENLHTLQSDCESSEKGESQAIDGCAFSIHSLSELVHKGLANEVVAESLVLNTQFMVTRLLDLHDAEVAEANIESAHIES